MCGQAVCAGLAAMVLAAGAGAAGKSGPIQIYVTGTTVTTPILVTGVVTDYGKATSVTKTGKPDENGNYEKIVLQKGGFWVDATALNKKINNAPGDDRQEELLLRVQGFRPDEAVQRHGCVCGHQRDVTVTVNFVALGPRLKNGKCNLSNNAAPVAQYGVVTGAGTASY